MLCNEYIFNQVEETVPAQSKQNSVPSDLSCVEPKIVFQNEVSHSVSYSSDADMLESVLKEVGLISYRVDPVVPYKIEKSVHKHHVHKNEENFSKLQIFNAFMKRQFQAKTNSYTESTDISHV